MIKSLQLLFAVIPIIAAADVCADWLQDENVIAMAKLHANISPPGARPGTVVASPQRTNPDYYFHWTRDAALVMYPIVDRLQETSDPGERAALDKMMRDFVEITRFHQSTNALTNLGEPKFNTDGSPFMDQWGRPQNDGPALRAVTLMRYARHLMSRGESIHGLYSAELPALSPIKMDLEYVSHHWREPSYDLWEEIMGDHFYTRMVQRRAMIEGAAFAQLMGDKGAADWYRQQAAQLSAALQQHWDPARELIMPTLNRTGGIDYKTSQLDAAVILGVLHGHTDDGFFSYSDLRVQKTAVALVRQFKFQYPINSHGPGVAIGRYPEDLYAGSDFNGGNPWVLTTLAMAELLYRQGVESNEPKLRAYGDQFVQRVQMHAHADGSLNEQFSRYSGYMTSVYDLTWNYAAALTALRARNALDSVRR